MFLRDDMDERLAFKQQIIDEHESPAKKNGEGHAGLETLYCRFGSLLWSKEPSPAPRRRYVFG